MRLRLFRFLVVGTVAAALLFALSWAFISLGLPPFAGGMAAYAIAFVVAYSAQHGWTFGGIHGHRHSLPRYFSVQFGCALLSGIAGHFSAASLHASPIVASAIITIVASSVSYVLCILWVFPRRLEQDERRHLDARL
jgi:putative flippase GtrA